MRKINLFIALSALYTGLQSQPLTGLNTYQHTTSNLQLTDGSRTTFNSKGFILAGDQPSSPATSPGNIFIDKTDIDGMFNGSPGEFQNAYTFMAAPSACGPAIANVVNCYGVSVSEVTLFSGPQWYTMVAGFDFGCLYAELDMAGNVITSAYYTYPRRATNPSKPLITPSVFFPGKYYICGSYTLGGVSRMYALLVGIGGGIVWSNEYSDPTGDSELIPSAIIESPYSTPGAPQLAVVGTYNNGVTSTSRDGFFELLNGNNGAISLFSRYGTNTANDRFLSLGIASAVAGGSPGFIIGGSSYANTALGSSWMLKIKPTGGIIWTKLIQASTGTTGEVVAVRERKSAAYGFEYYGAAAENNGMTVFKLDAFGNIFSQPGNPTNEFIYNDNLGGNAVPAAISFLDNTTANDGIHVFGTNTTGTGDYFLTRACFNGAAGNAGCTLSNITLNTLPTTNPGPASFNGVTIALVSGPVNCPNYSFTGASMLVNVVAPCNENTLPTVPYIGNQNRTMAVTGIKAVGMDNKFSVSPNPVTDKLIISYTAVAGSGVSVSLFNSLGQLVTPALTSKATEGQNELELNLSTMAISSGVYFVKVQADGVTTTKKIIYTK